MTLMIGSRLGSYEILAPLGAGGMGEVYRAHDAKLNRDVAIKVLPELFAHDTERLARFEREAKVLASLNHPNIAHIFGFEEAGSGQGVIRALVLELVDGPTLADRIARGPLPLTEALAIARQVAEALEAAHEQGVIHRDLKPANIKVRDDGTVKVLDFGLAKALDPAGTSGVDAMNSPTLTARATQLGVILGTAAYMAPEQAKGKVVDKRADVWAFGCVLYEMLTGRRPFQGEDISETLASVLKEDPSWDALPPEVPVPVRRLLRRCLEKDPKQRLRSIGDVPFELAELRPRETPAPAPAPARSGRSPLIWLAGGALVGAMAAAAAMVFVVPRFRVAPERSVARLSILAPEDISLFTDSADLAIAPDGRSLVFTGVQGTGTKRLWLRSIDATDARALPGTDNAALPFWSPDGRSIGFFADGKLKKIAVAGGTVEVLCDAKDGRGGTWSPHGVIIFSPNSAGPLQSISANGGDPKPVTVMDASRGESGHRFPYFLPDGRHFLYAALPARDGKFEIYAGSIDGSAASRLTAAETSPVYAAPGYLLFGRKNVLVAQRFDADRLQLSGEPVSLGDLPGNMGIQFAAGWAASVSATGDLAYLATRLTNTNLVWLDRSGRQVGTVSAPPGRYAELRIAPDGHHAAAIRAESPAVADIWILDLDRSGATRLTNGPGYHMEPTWSPDSRRLAYARMFSGPRDLFSRVINGSTAEEPILKGPVLFKDPYSWSPDGKSVVFAQRDPQTNDDLWILPLEGDRKPTLYRKTPFNEDYASISPDGKWLAFISDESGRTEVYVQAFPTAGDAVQITTGGAALAWWRADGKELAILSGDLRTMFVADVQASAAGFHTSPPRVLAPMPKNALAIDAARDLQRFLASVTVDESVGSSITVLLNWLGALKKS